MPLVYVLSIAAGLCFALGSVVQQRAAAQAPPQHLLSWRLLLWLVRQRLWLAGAATAVVGNIFSAVALGRGSVALVQPLLVVRLLFALPVSAAWSRRSVPRRDWVGALVTAGGLATFVVAGHPHRISSDLATPIWHWIIGGAVVVGVALSLAVGSRMLSPPRQAATLAVGAGMLFGLQAAMVGATFSLYDADGIVAVLTTWKLYAVIAAALTGTLLIQSAFEAAPLPASFPALTTAEPLTGIALGVGVLGGSIRLSPVPFAVEVAGLGAMCFGIYLLTSSPLVTGELDRLERRQEEGQAYRTETELERDLAKLRRDLDALDHHLGATELEHRDLAQVHADLERVAGEVDRLCELQEDIDRHRRAEQRRLSEREREPGAHPSAGEIAEIRRHDDALDAVQREIDERARRLRHGADAMRARARELEARVSGRSP